MNPLPAEKLPEVQLYTDGGCSGNPGPGGWTYILKHPTSGKEKEKSGGERETTNNRMEMTAAIRGLEALRRPTRVELISDSTYVLKGLNEWMSKWKKNGWRRRQNGKWLEVKNLANGRTVIVRVNDRGPFIAGRIIDLSYGAAKEIGMIGAGIQEVEIEVLR